jgi:hypothetical protein
MTNEEERKDVIRRLVRVSTENEMSAFYTSCYLAKQILSNRSFFKIKVIEDLKEDDIMKMKG